VKALPARGEVGIFNRSHYEDVLVVRVHDLCAEGPLEPALRPDQRLREASHRERNHGPQAYLHVSREEQAKRLAERIDDPTKNWKVNPGDFEEAKLWNDYTPPPTTR
jgi:polyphosphate kinase 2 (PPK2 family)